MIFQVIFHLGEVPGLERVSFVTDSTDSRCRRVACHTHSVTRHTHRDFPTARGGDRLVEPALRGRLIALDHHNIVTS